MSLVGASASHSARQGAGEPTGKEELEEGNRWEKEKPHKHAKGVQ